MRNSIFGLIVGIGIGVVGATGVLSLTQPRRSVTTPAAREIYAQKSGTDSANKQQDTKEMVSVFRFDRPLEAVKLKRQEISTAVASILELGRPPMGLLGRHISDLQPQLRYVTGAWLSTEMLTLYWDASDERDDHILAIEFRIPEFTIIRVGSP